MIFIPFKKCWIQFKKIVYGKSVCNEVECKNVTMSSFEEFDNIKEQLDFLIKKKEKIIFLVGQFGVGKTYIIDNIIKDYKKEGNLIFKKEFLNIKSEVSAYYNLVGYCKVFLFLIFFYLVFYRFDIFYSNFLFPIMLFFSYLLIFNKFRITYALYNFFSSCVDYLILSKFRIFELIKKILQMRDVREFIHKTYIIDDIARSNLSKNELHSFVSNVWKLNRTYIFVFGYSSKDNNLFINFNDINYLCNNLNAKLITVPIYYKLNEKILNSYLNLNFKNFINPFKNPTWLALFTPCDIVAIINNFDFKIEFLKENKKQFFDCDIFVSFLVLRVFIEKFFFKLNLNSSIKMFYILSKNQKNIEIIEFYQSISNFLAENIFLKRLQICDFCIFNNYDYRVKSSSDLFEIIFSESEEEFLSFLMLTSKIWIGTNINESFSETHKKLSG